MRSLALDALENSWEKPYQSATFQKESDDDNHQA